MGNREVYPNLSMTLLHSFRNVKTFSRRSLCSWRQLRKKKKKYLSWILQLTKVATGSCPLLSAVMKTCTREWGLSLSTSKWRFEWLCRGAFLSRVCRRRRLVNRSGDICDRDSWLRRKKTNTRRYSIVEHWIRLLLSPLPPPSLMVPVCLPDMAKCWVLYINVSSISPIRLTSRRSARHLVRFIREPLQLPSLTQNQQIVWNVGVCVYKEKGLDLDFFFS